MFKKLLATTLIFFVILLLIATEEPQPVQTEVELVLSPQEKQDIIRNSQPSSRATLFAAGDLLLSEEPGYWINLYGPAHPFEPLQGYFQEADLRFANLECAISNKGLPLANKPYTFRASQDKVEAIQSFDILSVANNHTLDFGEEAFLETLTLLKDNSIVPIGGGANLEEALTPATFTINGLTIGFLAYTDVNGVPFIYHQYWQALDNKPGTLTLKDLDLQYIEKIKKEVDILVVSLHWGLEYAEYPTKNQQQLAHQLIDSGVNLIIGHHPHIPQGIEIYNGGVIAYSLGNFLFGTHKVTETIALLVSFDPLGVYQVRVLPLGIKQGQVYPLPETEGQKLLSKILMLSEPFNTKGITIKTEDSIELILNTKQTP